MKPLCKHSKVISTLPLGRPQTPYSVTTVTAFPHPLQAVTVVTLLHLHQCQGYFSASMAAAAFILNMIFLH